MFVRWDGQLFRNSSDNIVAKPSEAKWGSFGVRKEVFELPEFQKLVEDTELKPWNGDPEELDPVLPAVTSPGFAVVDWFSWCMGKTGQGIARLHENQRWKDEPDDPSQKDEGISAWIHGCDIMNSDCEDGLATVQRGDMISYFGTEPSREPGKPPKLVNVEKV